VARRQWVVGRHERILACSRRCGGIFRRHSLRRDAQEISGICAVGQRCCEEIGPTPEHTRPSACNALDQQSPTNMAADESLQSSDTLKSQRWNVICEEFNAAFYGFCTAGALGLVIFTVLFTTGFPWFSPNAHIPAAIFFCSHGFSYLATIYYGLGFASKPQCASNPFSLGRARRISCTLRLLVLLQRRQPSLYWLGWSVVNAVSHAPWLNVLHRRTTDPEPTTTTRTTLDAAYLCMHTTTLASHLVKGFNLARAIQQHVTIF
jgi:hypothetical protein